MSILQVGNLQVPQLVFIWVGILVLMYFVGFRPQQVQQRKRREMLSKLKKGDRVVTTGGLHAVILDVDGEVVSLELAPNLRVKADRGGISYVRNKKREDHPASTAPLAR